MNPAPDPDPALFFSDFEDANKVFLRITYFGYHTSVFKDNKSLKCNKTVKIKDFLNVFFLLMEATGSGAGSV
jgi:hypothetical protein